MARYSFLLTFFIVLSPVASLSAEISGPEIIIQEGRIFVSTGLHDIGEIRSTIGSGIEKEFVFTIEIFRARSFWPDEFVKAARIQRAVKYDTPRKMYFTSTNDGRTKAKANFRDPDAMIPWVFRVDRINVANIRELEPGTYYARVVVESKSRELPPVIGLILFFIPEVEMSLAKESEPFILGTVR